MDREIFGRWLNVNSGQSWKKTFERGFPTLGLDVFCQFSMRLCPNTVDSNGPPTSSQRDKVLQVPANKSSLDSGVLNRGKN